MSHRIRTALEVGSFEKMTGEIECDETWIGGKETNRHEDKKVGKPKEIVFGMRELREEMVGPVHFLLAEALWRRFRDRTRRRLLLVDELGLLFEDPTMRRFVVRLARRIRKYDGSLVFATQNAGDLLGSEAGLVVATNPAIRFFGAQRPGEAQKLQRAFQLSDSQRQGLETARRGEFLLAAGHRRLPVQIQAELWQQEIIEGRRTTG